MTPSPTQASWPIDQIASPQSPVTSEIRMPAAERPWGVLEAAKVNGVALRRRLHWPKR